MAAVNAPMPCVPTREMWLSSYGTSPVSTPCFPFLSPISSRFYISRRGRGRERGRHSSRSPHPHQKLQLHFISSKSTPTQPSHEKEKESPHSISGNHGYVENALSCTAPAVPQNTPNTSKPPTSTGTPRQSPGAIPTPAAPFLSLQKNPQAPSSTASFSSLLDLLLPTLYLRHAPAHARDPSLAASIAALQLHLTLEALLHLCNGDLPSAHFLVRHLQGPPAVERMLLHAILHRVEEDFGNARAWMGDVRDACAGWVPKRRGQERLDQEGVGVMRCKVAKGRLLEAV